MDIDLNDIKNLYTIYDYNLMVEEDNYLVFSIRYGRYYAVDIVPKKNDISLEHVKSEYSELGYAVNIVQYSDLFNLDKYLFSGNFSLEQTRIRFKHKYNNYISRQESRMIVHYEYIDCPFMLNGEENKSSMVVQTIMDSMAGKKPVLILIEAAAGYGKTTTSYELFNTLLNNSSEQIPLHTEFSRDRQARIIKHLLQDVINKEFTSLSYELVVHEITTGRIPLIIDGFDELISKNNVSPDDEIANLTPMLTTIAELLSGNAKIILTSRSTALFTSEDFADWLELNSEKFEIVQIRLLKPNVSKWIGYDKYQFFKDMEFNIEMVANPVLLNYLRNISIDKIKEIYNENYDILDDYFNKMLERETERQKLKFTINEQLQILKMLAKQFLSYGLKAEDKTFIKELISEENGDLINSTLLKYTGESSIEYEELLEILSNHALLDKRDSNKVGFINDFVLGILCGDYAIESGNEAWLNECFQYEDNILLVDTAYKVRDKKRRKLLYQVLIECLENSNAFVKLICESDLVEETNFDYINEEISEIEIDNCKLANNSKISDCIFREVVFKDVEFYFSNIDNVVYYYCTFENCSIHGNVDDSIEFFQCDDYKQGFLPELAAVDQNVAEAQIKYDDYEVLVLQQFYPKGSNKAKSKRKMTTLLLGFGSEEIPNVKDAIERLRKKSLIFVKGERAELNLKNAREIYRMLGKSSI